MDPLTSVPLPRVRAVTLQDPARPACAGATKLLRALRVPILLRLANMMRPLCSAHSSSLSLNAPFIPDHAGGSWPFRCYLASSLVKQGSQP